MRIYIWALLVIGLMVGETATGRDIPKRPEPARLVNDFGGLLSDAEASALERKLVTYNDSTSTQIAIVTESDLGDEEIFDYTVRLAQAWGIGQGEEDNGILLYIAVAERKIQIQTGYGAEGFLPDAMVKRIIEQVIKPAFREGRYYAGLEEATDIIMALGSGEYKAKEGGKKDRRGNTLLIIFLVVFVLLMVFGKRQGGDDDEGGYWRGGRYDTGHRRGGGWVIFPGGGFGGSGGFGGGGGFGDGGGFGGFGGGDFGGGGAGGDW